MWLHLGFNTIKKKYLRRFRHKANRVLVLVVTHTRLEGHVPRPSKTAVDGLGIALKYVQNAKSQTNTNPCTQKH